MCNVIVNKGNQKVVLVSEKGQVLLSLLQRNDLFIESPCGGRGTCGKCKVTILEGHENISYIDAVEKTYLSILEQKQGIRLACRVKVYGDIKIEINTKDQSKASVMIDGAIKTSIDSDYQRNVKKENIKLRIPSVSDQRSDVQRLEDGIGIDFKYIPKNVLSTLSEILRKSDYDISIAYSGDTLLGVEQGNTEKNNYGIALDIGTTTIAGYLININSGEQIDVYSSLNPQAAYGSDVISRCDFSIENSQGIKVLNQLILDEINSMIAYFVSNNGISRNNIYQLIVVGNTIMLHLLLALPVKNIALSPFIPVITKKYDTKAKQAGIAINPNGIISYLPCISGYVGADTVAAIVASEMYKTDDISLLIDIGTNGEIALGNRDKMICCSVAAGPAFEGAHIKNGVGGIEGAINKVYIDDDCRYQTIGGKQPIGVCGSGIVDGIAEMLDKGIIDNTGRIRSKEELEDKKGEKWIERIIQVDGKPAFLIERLEEQEIVLCQKDIREVQLAKSAIAAGINILINEMKIKLQDIKNVYLAGGFGNYIDHDNAVRIGIIPDPLKDRIIPIGNGAGVGAKIALLSHEHLMLTEELRRKIQYIELSSRMDFQEMFIDYISF
ncbi:MAG: ASKHA domain-containing protein [Clostridia bacterium]|nr:ASKHA domain-containing protein [Clostridia bacterium]